MARPTTVFRCQSCGGTAPKWAGRCPQCSEWNTLVEEVVVKVAAGAPRGQTEAAVPIAEVDASEWQPRATGVDELDRVLGGGLVPGSVTLVGGEPGVGKSTLLLQVAAAVARSGQPTLYISGEESRSQVRLRAERLDCLADQLWLASETVLPAILDHLDQVKPDVVIVDSIQTVHHPELSSAAGSVGQVRECAQLLVVEAKRRPVTVILVGHVTKDGQLAGPRVLEHVVDTVLNFEGDRHHALRLLRAVKHRFGSTAELGLFEMAELGLIGVPDPSKLFLADRRKGVAGSVVVPTLEGHRPLLVEVQALVAPSTSGPSPRRSVQGLDAGRLALLLAVLDRRVRYRLHEVDVYASAVGGVKVVEPGADLPVALAVVSASTGHPWPPDLVACGEIGLGGEVRQVSQTGRRLAEAARLGFRRAIVPSSVADGPDGLTLHRVSTLGEAVALLEADADGGRRGSTSSASHPAASGADQRGEPPGPGGSRSPAAPSGRRPSDGRPPLHVARP